jgi:hypothetical protein
MNRIVTIGNSDSGKRTMGDRLVAEHELPRLDLAAQRRLFDEFTGPRRECTDAASYSGESPR